MMEHVSHWKTLKAGKQGLSNNKDAGGNRGHNGAIRVLGVNENLIRTWKNDQAVCVSLAVASASSWPCATQGVGPAADQDIPLTVRKALDHVITETSVTLCQLSRRVPHICCPATHWCQLRDTKKVLTHSSNCAGIPELWINLSGVSMSHWLVLSCKVKRKRKQNSNKNKTLIHSHIWRETTCLCELVSSLDWF